MIVDLISSLDFKSDWNWLSNLDFRFDSTTTIQFATPNCISLVVCNIFSAKHQSCLQLIWICCLWQAVPGTTFTILSILNNNFAYYLKENVWECKVLVPFSWFPIHEKLLTRACCPRIEIQCKHLNSPCSTDMLKSLRHWKLLVTTYPISGWRMFFTFFPWSFGSSSKNQYLSLPKIQCQSVGDPVLCNA